MWAFAVWCLGAILYTHTGSGVPWYRWLLGAVWLGFVVLAAKRPSFRGALVVAEVAILVGFLAWPPSHDRDWTGDLQRLSWAEIDGDLVTVHDIRDFRYRAKDDWDEAWYDATFDVNDLVGAQFVVEPFSEVFEGAAHTMITFEFTGGRHLVVSVETRREKGESYSVLAGLYRSYELQYVAGDERDLIQLRTNHRKDPVFLHPLDASKERLVAYFLDVMARMNALREQPEFYNTLTSSCTTNLVDHLEAISEVDIPAFDYRIILPGYSAEVAYELGLIDTDLSLEDTKARDLINERAERFADRDDFSAGIRGLIEP